MTELSPRQAEVFRFMEEFQIKNGRAPTQREAALHMGVNPKTHREHANAIVRKRYARPACGKWRGIQIRSPLLDFGRRAQLCLLSYLRGKPTDHGLTNDVAAALISAYLSASSENGESGSDRAAVPAS